MQKKYMNVRRSYHKKTIARLIQIKYRKPKIVLWARQTH